MNNLNNDSLVWQVVEVSTYASEKLDERHANMYAYQTGALEATLQFWIATGNAPGLEKLSADNRAALKEFIERQISLIRSEAERSAGL